MRSAACFAVVWLAFTVGCGRKDDECPRAAEADTSCVEPRSAEARSAAPASAAALSTTPSSPSAAASSSASAPVPHGYVRVYVASVVATEAGAAVLLSPEPESEDATLLPIFVGGTEALSIDLRHRGEKYARPLTHDLLDSTLASLGSKVVEARITKLSGTTFIGALFVVRGGERVEVDARPSDAIALALGNDAPIFVASAVIEKAGVSKKELLQEKGRKRGDPTML